MDCALLAIAAGIPTYLIDSEEGSTEAAGDSRCTIAMSLAGEGEGATESPAEAGFLVTEA
jgi:hypothetical protein